MKTVEMIKFGKGFYVMTRENGRAMARQWFKNKTQANARVKDLKHEGYTVA